jgi:hypothetical protein
METNGDECPAIVIEYLVHYCYEQSAKALLKEIKQLDKCNATSEKDCKHGFIACVDKIITHL